MSTEQVPVCRAEESALLLVDLQERLAAAMDERVRSAVLRNAGVLTQAADKLGVPVLFTEQYPKGLGPTEEAVRQHLPASARRFEKTCFSCCGADGFLEVLRATERRQVVLSGMEAHVCVMQTALELQAARFEVFVVGDAACSRNPANRGNAMQRLREAGVTVSNTESVVFEWLRDASHEHFKAISKLVR